MNDPANLATFEAIIDDAAVAESIEALLPVGVRPRQLSVRTLLVGILLALVDGRPAHLTRVHAALLALPHDERARLGVVVEHRAGPHLLTYRQTEYMVGLIDRVLSKDAVDGAPTDALQSLADDLIEASIPTEYKQLSRDVAVDWTDVESFARPPLQEGGPTADPEASWGHRRGNGPGQNHELFYGYYLQLATMVGEEDGAAVPEAGAPHPAGQLPRRPAASLRSWSWTEMVASGVGLGDVLADSGYAHRVAEHWALPLRALGANLVMDLHPHDRGTQGTHHGAICFNGNLYCPAHPKRSLHPWARWRAERVHKRSRSTTTDPPSWPATSWAPSRPTTPTAFTASPAPPCWARCAVRGDPNQWRSRVVGPRSSSRLSSLRPAARKRLSPSPRASTPRPGKSMTTRAGPIAFPMAAARRPSDPTPRSKILPPTTSPVVGVASWG